MIKAISYSFSKNGICFLRNTMRMLAVLFSKRNAEGGVLLGIIIAFVGDKEFFASKTKQYIANGTVAKSLPENQPIAQNTLVQRIATFLSKLTEIQNCIPLTKH